MDIDEVTFNEIKAAQESGVNSADVCKEFKINLKDCNKVFESSTYASLTGEESERKAGELGHFRSTLFAKKEIKILPEQRLAQLNTLNNQIKVSWDMINLLEHRKRQLSEEIQNMEKYIQKGLDVIEDHIER